MKNLLFTIALVFTTLFSFAQDSEKGITITVTIDNVKNNEGTVLLSLHTSETFMKGKGVMSGESKIENNKVVITFDNVKPGEYAILALHDENNNKNMDYETNGMPKEDYGMSNNVMSFGPPQYDDAKFKVENEDIDLNIRF
ncbi:MAG: hypothetical protein CMC76_07835 [Flavobacteriaceae bacterium]|uniref:DUF2141 domain-containing protein n=1 Tax=Winogradskyella sp. SYSU M77433 TaxID=3042722 RepID=UPI000C540BB8|nr:DUF2141 domain-containing protein [Winogradskyella sp. SYSU M77433]MAX71000.1 hypothetical protein [Flavobacteriaceae bacterium]MDH7912868.1 DUF2141 domain-containing protein [Winogradskyella sp. SYSU M77433]